MGKYLDKTGLQYFYNKLKEKFADKTTIENKLNSLTGALTWKGELSALPATTNYTAGNVIKVGTKEYVLTESNGTKTWDELGDEGSYLLKTTAEETYLKKADGEVKTANLADGSVTKMKLDVSVNQALVDNAKRSEPNIFTNTNSFNGYCTFGGSMSTTSDSSASLSGTVWINNELYTYSKDVYLTNGCKLGNKGVLNTVELNSKYRTSSDDNALTLTNQSSSTKPVGISNVAEPIEDTDAANKAYVDTSVSSKADKSTLATSLQAITIYTDNTTEHKAQNLANIKAYEDNLKAMGVDGDGCTISVTLDMNLGSGIISLNESNKSNDYYPGIYFSNDAEVPMSFVVSKSDGSITVNGILTIDKQFPQLYTTSKQIIPAINEVNTLATRKATLTQDGVVRVELKDATSNYSSLQSSLYPKMKVARDKDGVLAVGAAKDKNTYGVVKIGDGINVTTEGVISVSTATTSANGLMSSADKTKLTGIADGATRIIGVVVNGATKTAANGLLNIGTVLTTVDGTINAASNNPVSNSAVASALNGKVSKTGLMTINNQAITGGGNINVATEKVTLAYNPDDSYMTGEQYRNIFTDAYESGKIPNVELVYTAEGDYEVLSLKRIDKDDAYYHLYFSSSSIEDNINVYAYGVRVDVLREDDSTAADHDMNCTELQSTSFQLIAKDVVNKTDASEICTASTVTTTLTTASKKNFIIMPTVGTAQFRFPSIVADGYTLTFTIVGTATSFALITASSTQPVYNVSSGSTATKYTAPTATRCKIISTYSTALKQWITYRQSIA